MSPGGTGGNNDPVQALALYHLFHLVLGVLRAGKQVLFHIAYTGESTGIFRY